MDLIHVRDAAGQIADDEESVEAIRTDAFSLEVMKFEEGDEDPMHSHDVDEVYQITSGTAKINVDGDTSPVSPGDVIYLEPGTEHQFVDFDDEFVLTVLYAPAKESAE